MCGGTGETETAPLKHRLRRPTPKEGSAAWILLISPREASGAPSLQPRRCDSYDLTKCSRFVGNREAACMKPSRKVNSPDRSSCEDARQGGSRAKSTFGSSHASRPVGRNSSTAPGIAFPTPGPHDPVWPATGLLQSVKPGETTQSGK